MESWNLTWKRGGTGGKMEGRAGLARRGAKPPLGCREGPVGWPERGGRLLDSEAERRGSVNQSSRAIKRQAFRPGAAGIAAQGDGGEPINQSSQSLAIDQAKQSIKAKSINQAKQSIKATIRPPLQA